MNIIAQIRKAQIYMTTSQVAAFVGMSNQWVRDNRKRFGTPRRMNGKRNFEFEFSEVVKVWAELQEKRKSSIESRYRGASRAA